MADHLNETAVANKRSRHRARAYLRHRHRQNQLHRADSPTSNGWVVGFAAMFMLTMMLLYALGYLFVRGVGIWGINIPIGWGFAIVNFVWWIGIGHAGTLISAILLLLRQSWRNSINRFAEAMTLFAVASAGIFPVVHTGRPWLAYWMFPYPNTMEYWPQFRSPLIWDVFAVSTYFTVSLMFWFIGLIPDLATLRDRAENKYASMIYGLLAMGWRGSARHWARYEIGLPAAGRTCHAARALGPHGRQLRFRGRHRPRLAHHDLPALFRRGRHLLRLRHGSDAGDSRSAKFTAWKISSPTAIWRTPPRSCSPPA